MKPINFSKLTLKTLLFYVFVLFVGDINAQTTDPKNIEINSQKEILSKLYKNPYNDISLLSMKLLENGFVKFKFKKKIKAFSMTLKRNDTISFFHKEIYDINGFISETLEETYENGVKNHLNERRNLKFKTIKSKNDITYIFPEYLLYPSKTKKYKGLFDDFNEHKIDIVDFLLKYTYDQGNINKFTLKLDQNENLIYYRQYFIENDSVNKTITLKEDNKGILEISKVVDYNLNTLKDFTNPSRVRSYSYNEKGDIIKTSYVLSDGTIQNEEFFSPEYGQDDKIAKIIKTNSTNTEKATFDFFYNESGLLNKIKEGDDKNYGLYEFEYY